VRKASKMVEVQPTISRAIYCPSCVLDRSLLVQLVKGRSQMCVSYAQEISPILLYLFIQTKGNKGGNKQGHC